MLKIYIIISTLLFIVFLPLIIILSWLKKKHRDRFFQKIGFLSHKISKTHPTPDEPVIWIHALSVGEVTSALPLIKGLRHRFPKGIIYFSTTTQAGMETARKTVLPLVDNIFYGPFDMHFAVRRFIKQLNPTLFILIETDFWPCWLYSLHRSAIPCLLANGRCSEKSFNAYQRFDFFFRPMFNCFSLLAMQTAKDADNIKLLGIDEKKIICPGNLKFDTALPDNTNTPELRRNDLGLPEDNPLLICGSTHHGEEEIIFQAYREVINKHPELILMIAPRDINRTQKIIRLADKYNFRTVKRTQTGQTKKHIFAEKHRSYNESSFYYQKKLLPEKPLIYILDTLGELSSCYHFADLCFIGGSMVPAGGHNPLEAARASLPILFGPHMEDFSEISNNLVRTGGALIVHNQKELSKQIFLLLEDENKTIIMGKSAKKHAISQQGVVHKYINNIKGLI